MTKDEMKNRISMALKDPVLQQGFEIICKNLAELEGRNDNLVKMYNEMVERQNSSQQSLYKDLVELTDEIVGLKRENAELNKNLSKAEAEYDEMFWQKNETIFKAKELIRKLSQLKHHTDDPFTYDEYIKLIKAAEQFLKETHE